MKKQTNIYIIGAGAIGKALAVALKATNRNVILLRASIADAGEHETNLTLVLNGTDELPATIRVSSINNFEKLEGLVVLTNKSYGNPHISTLLTNKTGTSPLIIMQNGLGVEDVFIEKGFPEIHRCVLFATSQPVAENRINFKPVSPSLIGTVKGNSQALEGIVSLLNTDIFPFRSEENIQKIIWKKAIINCAYNSICPLIETDNGIFHREPGVLAMAGRIIAECLEIAQATGVALSEQEVTESLLMISRFSDGQLISSYQDILNKRTTEIDTLNFAVVKIAESLGMGHLAKETRLLGELTALKSDLSRHS